MHNDYIDIMDTEKQGLVNKLFLIKYINVLVAHYFHKIQGAVCYEEVKMNWNLYY